MYVHLHLECTPTIKHRTERNYQQYGLDQIVAAQNWWLTSANNTDDANSEVQYGEMTESRCGEALVTDDLIPSRFVFGWSIKFMYVCSTLTNTRSIQFKNQRLRCVLKNGEPISSSISKMALMKLNGYCSYQNNRYKITGYNSYRFYKIQNRFNPVIQGEARLL